MEITDSNSQENNIESTSVTSAKSKKGFNGLTATEWASLSKNVWNDLSSPRNKYQLEHGAVYPVKLAERVIKMYSREGDLVFDPFLGIGTTLIAAVNSGRNGVGTELNPYFADIAEQWLKENQGMFNTNTFKIFNDDCRNLSKYVEPNQVQVTVTSPPYADFIRKSVEDRKKTHKKSIIKLENSIETSKSY